MYKILIRFLIVKGILTYFFLTKGGTGLSSSASPIVRRLRPCRAVCPTATQKHSNQPRIRQGMYKYSPHAEKGQEGCFRANNKGVPTARAIWRTLLWRPHDLLVGNFPTPRLTVRRTPWSITPRMSGRIGLSGLRLARLPRLDTIIANWGSCGKW